MTEIAFDRAEPLGSVFMRAELNLDLIAPSLKGLALKTGAGSSASATARSRPGSSRSILLFRDEERLSYHLSAVVDVAVRVDDAAGVPRDEAEPSLDYHDRGREHEPVTDWNWTPISLPALSHLGSTGEAQPLPPEQWPTWMQNASDFVGAWFTPLDQPRSRSSDDLLTGRAQAEVLAERIDQKPPPHRYYKFFYCELTDGRVFQAGPSRDIGFSHHLNVHPGWLASYRRDLDLTSCASRRSCSLRP